MSRHLAPGHPLWASRRDDVPGEGRDDARGDERGNVTFIVMAFVMFLMAGATMIVTFAMKDEVSAQGRISGDAAALAGAEEGRDLILARLLQQRPTFSRLTCDTVGVGSARDYAEDNDGQLVDYCYNHLTGRAQVTIRIRQQASGRWEHVTAAARLHALPECHDVVTEETVTVTPSPTPAPNPGGPGSRTPEPTPSESTYQSTHTACSIAGLGEFLPGPGAPIDALRHLMEPRLDDVG